METAYGHEIAFEESAALDPNNEATLVSLGWVFYWAIPYERTIQTFDRTQVLNPSEPNHYFYRLAYITEGENEAAVMHMTAALQSSTRRTT